MIIPLSEVETVECACGCGAAFPKYDKKGRPRRYIPGHNMHISRTIEIITCACGCGETFPKYDKWMKPRRFIKGHQWLNFRPLNNVIECACGCGKTLLKYDDQGRPRNFIFGHKSKMKMSILKDRMSGKTNPHYREGRHIDERGYIIVLCPDHPNKIKGNYVYEHRLIMEKHLGRYLTEKEVVHHINGDHQDNRIENLELFNNNSKHTKHHWNNGDYKNRRRRIEKN